MNCEMNDAELDTIVGGTDCQTAIALAAVYNCTAVALQALGDVYGMMKFDGMQVGVVQGGCPK